MNAHATLAFWLLSVSGLLTLVGIGLELRGIRIALEAIANAKR